MPEGSKSNSSHVERKRQQKGFSKDPKAYQPHGVCGRSHVHNLAIAIDSDSLRETRKVFECREVRQPGGPDPREKLVHGREDAAVGDCERK